MAKSKPGLVTKSKKGRPTKYYDTITDLQEVERLAGLGLTNNEISIWYRINPDTLNEWMNKYPEFSDAIKRGKVSANTEVKRALYKSAIGYDLPIRKTKYAPPESFILNPNYDPSDKKSLRYIQNPNRQPILLEVIETSRHFPPNTASAINFLINRTDWIRGDKKDGGEIPPEKQTIKVEYIKPDHFKKKDES